MGKHKNSTQNKIILEFMEKYPDLAKGGFIKCDKPKVDALWQQLSESLNSAGPPQNDVNAWKKKWTEWKSEVKRKMAQNKAESRATGGGRQYAKHQLTANEKAIVRLCGFAQSVEDVSGIALDLTEDDDVSVEEEMPSTSSKRRLKKILDDQSEINLELNANVKELVKIEQQNASSLKRTYGAIEKGNELVARAINDLKKEFVRYSEGILNCKKEKLEIMKRQLDLETQKFEFQKKQMKPTLVQKRQ